MPWGIGTFLYRFGGTVLVMVRLTRPVVRSALYVFSKDALTQDCSKFEGRFSFIFMARTVLVGLLLGWMFEKQSKLLRMFGILLMFSSAFFEVLEEGACISCIYPFVMLSPFFLEAQLVLLSLLGCNCSSSLAMTLEITHFGLSSLCFASVLVT